MIPASSLFKLILSLRVLVSSTARWSVMWPWSSTYDKEQNVVFSTFTWDKYWRFSCGLCSCLLFNILNIYNMKYITNLDSFSSRREVCKSNALWQLFTQKLLCIFCPSSIFLELLVFHHLFFKMALSIASASEKYNIPLTEVAGVLLNFITSFSVMISLVEKLTALLPYPYLLMINNWKNQNL